MTNEHFDELRRAVFELDDQLDECWTVDGLPSPTLLSDVLDRKVSADEIARVGRLRKVQTDKPQPSVSATTAPTIDALKTAELQVEQARATVKEATIAHNQAKGDLAITLDRWTKANGTRDTESNARDFIQAGVAERAAAKSAPPSTPRSFASHLDAVAATRRTAVPDRGTGQSFRRGAAAR
jgi:MoxR-like ATPase